MAYVTLDQTKKVAQAVKTYTDGEVSKKVEKVDGKGLSTEDFSTEDKTKLESLENYDDTAIRQLIQQVKDDLASYYKKSETYSKTETDEIVSQINALEIIPVISLPTENIAKAIYLVKDSEVEGNIYSEYIYVDNKWEKFGTAVIDLSNYVTFTDLETKLNEKVKTNVPENAVFTDTVYDDSALTGRMDRAETAIENLQANGYDDTDIKNDINDLKTGKVDVVNGKELSSNDFTNDYKNKLDDLENYDDTEVRASITELQQSTAGQIASSITTINQAIANLEIAKVDKVDGKDLSDNNYSTEEKDKLASLENYDDTEVKNDIANLKSGKVNIVSGKELSTNDFTNEYKDKLDSLENYDDSEVKASIAELQQSTAVQIASSITTINQAITNLEEIKVSKVDGKDLSDNNYTTEEKSKLASLENYDDFELSGRVTTVEGLLDGHTVEKDVPSDAIFTDTVYDDTSVTDRLDAVESDIETLKVSGYDDTAITARVSANETAISTLNGSGAGSVSKAVSDAIDAVVDGASSTFDTLKEIADWIQDDQTGAAALAADVANKVDKVDGKGLSTEDFTTAEKTKLSGLSNYDDTSLAGRVSTVETTLADKANTADLSAVATSGSYNDLADTPDEYILPEASDTTLGGIKVDSTSGATVEDGVLKVTQQTASGGGAIPAYIVGDTMTQGWLSLTENGTALTPVDKQEYIILSSGDWLRKHVIWMGNLGVYRLTGKVLVGGDMQRKIKRPESFTVPMNGTIPESQHDRNARIATNILTLSVQDGDRVRVNFKYGLKAGVGLRQIHVGAPNNWSETVTTNDITHSYDSGRASFTEWSTWDKTYDVTQDMIANGFVVQLDSTRGSDQGTQNSIMVQQGSYTIYRNSPYYDYETDDIIDITEEEIDAIWNETAGEPAPENNVIAVGEERLWGYWKENGVTKPIYRKTVDCGALPNATLKQVPHGIESINRVLETNGYAYKPSTGEMFQMPFAQSGNNVTLFANRTAIYIIADKNISDHTESYVTLYYTKTTD